MAICFVIQPFDSDEYDRRYEETLSPAIRQAGLEPYRVDRDPHVNVPIEAIEEGIRSASLCLADISTDNPNVWYELGFALAANKPVVTICSQERQRFLFDVQHQAIITYSLKSQGAFVNLHNRISEKILALIEKTEALNQITNQSQVAPIGRNEHE